MTVSARVDSLLGNSQPQTTRAVSASVSSDGSSVDSSTSVLKEGQKDALFTDKKNGLGEEDFLKLLMTELKNQDPSSPMDNAQMMSQMAQLEAIQSNNNMEKAIREMSQSFQDSVSAQKGSAESMTNATAVSLIGKTVRIKEDQLTYSGLAGEKMTARISLGGSKQATVQILDADGAVVRTLNASNKDLTNAATVTWDGKNDNGTYLPAGTYTVNVVGEDKDPALYAFEEDVVQGVSFSMSGARLKVAGKELSVANVMDVAKNDAASAAGSLLQSSAIELLGKTIRVKQEAIDYKASNGENHRIMVNAGSSAPVTVSLLDGDGNLVAAFRGKTDDKGYAEFSWNGQSINGKFVDAATYRIKVDGADQNPTLYCYDEGTVDGVSTAGGSTKLRMNGNDIDPSDIIDIS
jgi:flagellar basal-body rod modification protein FlgD